MVDIKHEQVWNALDALAEKNGLSASALARRAGLDPTSFNKSKRASPEGRPRWPSTESIARVLAAVGADMHEFANFVHGSPASWRAIPILKWETFANMNNFGADGLPIIHDGEVDFSDISHNNAFAVEIDGQEFAPFLYPGDVIIIAPVASARRGDRILIRLRDGSVRITNFIRRTVQKIEVEDFLADRTDEIAVDEVHTIARILMIKMA